MNLAHHDGPPRLVRYAATRAYRRTSLWKRNWTDKKIGDMRQVFARLRLESRCVYDTSTTAPSCQDRLINDEPTELFLPSYADYDYDSTALEHKQDPVQDIVLSDEEAAAMLPR